MGSGADWRARWLQLGPGSGAGEAGAGGIGHRHGSPYADAAVRKPANAGRTPGVSMGERGGQAPGHCTLPKLLCPILCRVGGARRRLSGHTVLAPSTGGEAAHLQPSGGSSSGGSAASCCRRGKVSGHNLSRSAMSSAVITRLRALRACRKERAHEIENGSCLVAHVRRGGRGGVRRAAAAREGAGAARGGAGEGAGAGEGERAPHCTPPEPCGSAARSPRFSLCRSASSSRRKRRRGRARRRTRRASRSTG